MVMTDIHESQEHFLRAHMVFEKSLVGNIF